MLAFGLASRWLLLFSAFTLAFRASRRRRIWFRLEQVSFSPLRLVLLLPVVIQSFFVEIVIVLHFGCLLHYFYLYVLHFLGFFLPPHFEGPQVVLVELVAPELLVCLRQHSTVLIQDVLPKVLLLLLLLYLVISDVLLLLVLLFYYHVELSFFFRYVVRQKRIQGYIHAFAVVEVDPFDERLAVLSAEHLVDTQNVLSVLGGEACAGSPWSLRRARFGVLHLVLQGSDLLDLDPLSLLH